MSRDVALLIIDVQAGMFSPNLGLYNPDEVIANIRSLISKARTAEIPVIYIQHEGDERGPFGRGKPGWEIHPAILPQPDDLVVAKRTPDSFNGTVLQEELDKRGIKKLIVTGMQTEFCVDTTCRRAYALGYDTTLVKDAHSTFDSRVLPASNIIEHHNNSLGKTTFWNWFVGLKSTDEVEF